MICIHTHVYIHAHASAHIRMRTCGCIKFTDVNFFCIINHTDTIVMMMILVWSPTQVGMSVCVYYQGRQVANVCGGVYQSLEDGSSWAPVTPATLFMAYSVVKGVAATALLTCVDAGGCR